MLQGTRGKDGRSRDMLTEAPGQSGEVIGSPLAGLRCRDRGDDQRLYVKQWRESMGRIAFRWMIALCLLQALPALAQAPAASKAPTPPPSASQDQLGRSTPRGTVLGFIKAAQAQDHERAVQFLDA